MNILTDAQARNLLTHPLLNITEVARLFYHSNPTDRPYAALMRRLRSQPLTDDTLVKLSHIVFVHFQFFADLHADVSGDDNFL